MDEITLVYVPFGSAENAEETARSMVSGKLAACANILGPSEAIYHWQGAIESTSEIVALFKTAPDRCDALIAALTQAHDYDLPAILNWRVSTTPHYADWVHRETRLDAAPDS
jgi:periplasmic divalent cation tolerance protein